MKIWTLQERNIRAELSTPQLLASWDYTPKSWRNAYRWMVTQWSKQTRLSFDSAPFWCWHSCHGTYEAPPTVLTASLLIGDWKYAKSMVLVELNVPDELCLLSSYSIWNDALSDFLEHNRITIQESQFSAMFDEPLLKHSMDDIQAVIPYIMSDWIADIRNLPESEDDCTITI